MYVLSPDTEHQTVDIVRLCNRREQKYDRSLYLLWFLLEAPLSALVVFLCLRLQCRCHEQLLSPMWCDAMRCNKQEVLRHVIKINNLIFCSGDLYIIDSFARPVGDVPMPWTELNSNKKCGPSIYNFNVFESNWIRVSLTKLRHTINNIRDDLMTKMLENHSANVLSSSADQFQQHCHMFTFLCEY